MYDNLYKIANWQLRISSMLSFYVRLAVIIQPYTIAYYCKSAFLRDLHVYIVRYIAE